MAEGTVLCLMRYTAVLLLQLTFTHLCLTFHLEGSQTSYAAFSRWNPCLNGSLSFEFKTDQPNALLMYTDDGGKRDFFEVKLVGGIVRLRLNLGDGTVILTAGHNLNNMQWHKVEVIRSNEQTTLIVEGMSESRSSKGLEFAFGEKGKTSYVYFGGMPIQYSGMLSSLALPSVMFEPRYKGLIRNIFYSVCGGPIERPAMVNFKGVQNSKEDLCDQSNPCENGGMCLSLDNGVHCDCSRTDYEGKFCTQAKNPSEATFFGAHYLSYDLSSRGDPIVSNLDEISLHFRTRHANGLLFYTGDGADYLNIALKNGGIAVSVNLGSGAYSTDIQPAHQRFDDNRWHHLEVTREAREIQVKVDGKEQDFGSASGDFTLLSSNILYVAGSPNTAQLPGSLVPNNFKGCLRKVVYKADSIKLDLIDLARTEHNLINIIGDVLFDKCQDLVESQPVTFTSPESFITLPTWQVDKNGSVSFQFQTVESNGVIMYNNGANTNSDFFALEILDRSLYLILDLGSGPIKLRAPGRTVADGLPHQVLVSLDGQNGFFQLDGHKIDFATPGADDILSLDGKLYVGGISDHRDAFLLPQEMWAGMLGFGYVGCLQDLVLNGVKIDLAQLAKQQSSQGIAEYCRTMEPQCLSRPCMHKGVCHEGWNRFVCDCRAAGYIGPVCQEAATTLKFDGTQHMKVSLPEESVTEAEDISLRFKTIYPNGLLFVTTTRKSEDSMELSVDGGSVRFDLSLGGSTTSVVVGTGVNDGYWHTVYIKRRAQKMEVRIDDQRPRRGTLKTDGYTFEYSQIILGSTEVTVDATAKSRSQATLLNFESLEVGNMMLSDDNSLRAPTSFNGEMQQFVFNNNQFIELASSGQIQNIELTATVNSQEVISDPVTFKSKTAYVMLPQFQAYSSFTLYFQFRTTEPSGLIFYNDGKEQDFIAVELTDGHLFYSFSVGAGSSRVKIESPAKLNDNEWHDVAIIRPDHSQHILRVDGAPPTVHKAKEMQIVHFDLTGPLYVGGVKKTMYSLLPRSVVSREGFQGCLASLDLNSEMLSLMASPDRIVGSVAEGCQGPTVLCDTDSCLNNGRCVQLWNSFSCNCDLTSYTGPRCTEESISYSFGAGEGLITYRFPDGKHPKTTYDELALGFITDQTDAVLLRIDSESSEDYIEMELVGGNIFVVYNMGNEDHPVGELFTKVSDGKYHVVRFTRTGPNSTIQVDNMMVQPKTPEGRQLSMFNDQAVIVIGGSKTKDGRIVRPFRGTMSGLVFNGIRLLDMVAQGDPQITVEGAVTMDMGLTKDPKPDIELETVEDLVKAGWQSTEGVRSFETTVPPPAVAPRKVLENHIWREASGSGSWSPSIHPGFEDMEGEEESSGSGSGGFGWKESAASAEGKFSPSVKRPDPSRNKNIVKKPITAHDDFSSNWSKSINQNSGRQSKISVPGFDDMESFAKQGNFKKTKDKHFDTFEDNFEGEADGFEISGSGSGFSSMKKSEIPVLSTTPSDLSTFASFNPRMRWKVEDIMKKWKEVLNRMNLNNSLMYTESPKKPVIANVIPVPKPRLVLFSKKTPQKKVIKTGIKSSEPTIDGKKTGINILSDNTRRHTTPRQDVTDEIIFAGEGSGCHSDDEDDCTDVVSGHEDDIITPTVIIRTTPAPKTTSSSSSKPTTPCDDEDCEGSGDGKLIQPTKKPSKPRKGHSTTSHRTATKGTATTTTHRPQVDVTGLTNITVFPGGVSDDDSVNRPTDKPIKTGPRDDLNLGLIIGIVAGVVVALIILIYALYKFRSRDEGSYKIDETQNFAYVSEPKKAPINGGLKPNNNCPPSKTGKKRDVKEWYV